MPANKIPSLIHLTDSLSSLIKTRLWLQVLLAMLCGIGAGILLGPSLGLIEKQSAELIASWLAFPGKLFLLVIQFITIPLIVASVICGIAAGDKSENMGKLATGAILFFIISTIVAVVIGLFYATWINPGSYIEKGSLAALGDNIAPVSTSQKAFSFHQLPEMVIGLFPKDPLISFVSGNMLQIVISATIIGIALVSLPKESRKPLIDLLKSIQSVCMVVVSWALKFVPIAVFGLLANITARVGISTLLSALMYVITVLLGLLTLLIIYLLIAWIVRKTPPWVFVQSIKEVQLLALSTSSSAAVMPLTLRTAEDTLKVRQGIARFVVPLGATINMAGTALYQGIATIFLAQAFNIDIGFAGMLLIVLMATGASIGSPGTPGVGIVILATILESVGIPASGIALIIGVDRILDMCRTSVNVTGDIIASILLDKFLPEQK